MAKVRQIQEEQASGKQASQKIKVGKLKLLAPVSDSIQVRGRQELNRLEGGVFNTSHPSVFYIFNTSPSAQNTPSSVVCVPHSSRDFIRWLVLEAECPWVSHCSDEEPLKRDDSVIKRREKNSAGGRHAM